MNISQGVTVLPLVGLILLSGCHEHPPGPDGQGHDHEPRTAQVTVWENGHEAFVEHEYPVAGKPVRFITHISKIDTGEPRREGPLIVVLRGPSGTELRHEEETVARDGIYLPSLSFPTAGTWSVSLEIPLEGSSATVALGEVEVYPDEDTAAHAPGPEEVEGISFLKEQQWKLSLRTELAATRSLVARETFPGRVLPRRGHRVAVASPLAGRLVTPPGAALASVGARVGEGDLLALVHPALPGADLLALEVRLAGAEAEELRTAQALELARKTVSRNERLASANAKSERELELARYEFEAARAAHEAAVAVKKRYARARDLAGSIRSPGDASGEGFGPVELRAPIAGTVVRVQGSAGEHVSPQMDLFVLLDASVVTVEASVSEVDLERVGDAPSAYLEPRPDERLELRLAHVGLEVDPTTRTVPFLYEAPNPIGRLRPGMMVEVFLETGRAADVVAIPESALVDEDGRRVAFVQLSGETFEKRQLELGVRDRGFVEVVEGIAAGDRVVVTDPWSIRLASLSTVIPAHGHEH